MKFFGKNQGYVMIVAAITIVLAGIGVVWGISYIADTYIKPINPEVPVDAPKVKIPSLDKIKSGITLKKTEAGEVNMLLLGISGEDYISGNLADTIILATINTESNTANLFSLPRDLWISYEGKFQKINELYRIAGGTEVPNVENDDIMKQKVQDITGQDIHYTAIISLEGIKQFVDIMGGIETEEGRMNGEEALTYIRDRSRPGGDFDRMSRQQKLMLAILNKLNSAEHSHEGDEDNEEEHSHEQDSKNISEELLTSLEKHMATDMTLVNMFQLDLAAHEIDLNNIGMYAITPETGLLYSDYTNVAGQQIYTLHPTAGYEDYSQIQDYINKILN